MESSSLYLLAADIVLSVHVVFVAFVVIGLPLIFAGHRCAWRWVRNPFFRYAHVLAIGVVTTQAWLGVVCPLTTLEMALRSRAGDSVYSGGFIAHWLQRLLYYEAPGWVFVACYTLFAALVVLSWYVVRPRPFGRSAYGAADE